MIKSAIKENQRLEILYLKKNDVKSRRIITPIFAGEMEYNDKIYIGMEAFCHLRNERRVFRLDRILEINRVFEKESIDTNPVIRMCHSDPSHKSIRDSALK